MTDKVQKIKEWISKTQDGLMDDNGNFEYPEHEGAYDILCNLDAYIDSLQEKPNAKFKVGQTITDPTDSTFTFHINKIEDGRYIEKEDEWVLIDASEKPEHEDLLIETNDGRIIHRQSINNYGMVKRWAYTSDLLNLDNSCNFGKNSQEEPVRGDFEMALAEMIDNSQKQVVEPWVVAAQWKDELIKLAKSEEPISEELEEAAWQYYDRNKPLMPPELDLHKELIDFFKAGARWKEQNYSNLSEVLDQDNLDEMAEKYSSCTYLEEVLKEGDREVLKARLNNTFKAGAQWQKEKMMKKNNNK